MIVASARLVAVCTTLGLPVMATLPPSTCTALTPASTMTLAANVVPGVHLSAIWLSLPAPRHMAPLHMLRSWHVFHHVPISLLWVASVIAAAIHSSAGSTIWMWQLMPTSPLSRYSTAHTPLLFRTSASMRWPTAIRYVCMATAPRLTRVNATANGWVTYAARLFAKKVASTATVPHRTRVNATMAGLVATAAWP